MPQCLKSKVFNQCVLPVMKYDTETWTLTIDIAEGDEEGYVQSFSAGSHQKSRSRIKVTGIAQVAVGGGHNSQN